MVEGDAQYFEESKTDLMAPPEMALRLFLTVANVANESGFEEIAYEFFVQVNHSHNQVIHNIRRIHIRIKSTNYCNYIDNRDSIHGNLFRI